jgi:hypothetical protein
MTSKRLTVLGLVTGGVLVLYALVWAATGNGPYYAEPAWDQKQAAATRFIVLTDWSSQAVLDRETGLTWEQSPLTTTHTWDAARGQCTARTTGGRKGWRLPSVHELASLVDPANSNPALPTGHPFSNVQSSFYWSATTHAENTAFAWDVSFVNGGVFILGKVNPGYVWCVRGGMNADQY